MDSAAARVKQIQDSLESHVRTREEVQHVRRVLALALRARVEYAPADAPLGLIDPHSACKIGPETCGLQRTYLQALDVNIRANNNLDELTKLPVSLENTVEATDTSDLQTHLLHIKSSQKLHRLKTVHKYLEKIQDPPLVQDGTTNAQLNQSDHAVNVKELTTPRLNGESSSEHSHQGIAALTAHLEQTVLRSKLLLQKERRLLAQIKTRRQEHAVNPSSAVREAALSATRDELVNWVEAELGRASEAEAKQDTQATPLAAERVRELRENIEQQLVAVRHHYTSYVESRKHLISLLGTDIQPLIVVNEQSSTATSEDAPSLAPPEFYAAPYIERLLTVAADQRASITLKSHINVVLAAQTRAACSSLDRLAHESHLLPAYPMPKSTRPRPDVDWTLSVPEGPTVVSRVQPWVYAAESAKIATLEKVAEVIETGHLAMERSIDHLEELEALVGKDAFAWHERFASDGR